MKPIIAFFGHGTNKDREMMEAIIGRPNIKGESGIFYGYELCIQNVQRIRNEVLSTAPAPISPRMIIKESFKGKNFDLYVPRPNSEAHVAGTIWYIFERELEYVNNWELIDFGMQELIKVKAITEDGKEVEVFSHALDREPIEIDHVITDDNYPAYIFDKATMLKRANEVREEYIQMMSYKK